MSIDALVSFTKQRKSVDWILYNTSAFSSELNQIVIARNTVYMMLVINQINAKILVL